MCIDLNSDYYDGEQLTEEEQRLRKIDAQLEDKVAELIYWWAEDYGVYFEYGWDYIPSTWRGKVKARSIAYQVASIYREQRLGR